MSRVLAIEVPSGAAQAGELFTRGRDALEALMPGSRSLLTDVRIVADDSLADGQTAAFTLEVRPGVSDENARAADILGVLRLTDRMYRMLLSGAPADVDPAALSTAERSAGRRLAAIAVLHELLHSMTDLSLLDYITDSHAAQADPVRLLFREAATQLATDYLLERWGPAAGVADACGVPAKLTQLVGDDAMEVRLIEYVTAESLLSSLVDAVSGNAELRECWINDLVTGAHLTSMERLGQGVVDARGRGDVATVTSAIRTALIESRSEFPSVLVRARDAASGVWDARGVLRRVTTPVVVDQAATDAMHAACDAVAAHAMRHVERALG